MNCVLQLVVGFAWVLNFVDDEVTDKRLDDDRTKLEHLSCESWYIIAYVLDLRQPKLALEYYQRAVALASARTGSFDAAAARARIAQPAR